MKSVAGVVDEEDIIVPEDRVQHGESGMGERAEVLGLQRREVAQMNPPVKRGAIGEETAAAIDRYLVALRRQAGGELGQKGFIAAVG